MEIEIFFEKNLEKNASMYFDKSKKLKQKAKNIEQAIKQTEKKIEKEKKRKSKLKPKPVIKKRKTEWFEKFHWFYSSENFLIAGGRDASSNETLVKKYMKKEDVYFHADIVGAPHCIIKTENKKPGQKTLNEAAGFAACFSKAWKEGIASVDVYSVKPEQVSKKAPSGEALGKGAFMIYGERKWFKKTPLDFFIGFQKIKNIFRIISGPKEAIEKHSDFVLNVKQGSEKKGLVAKKIKTFFDKKAGHNFPIEEVEKMLPSGKMELKA